LFRDASVAMGRRRGLADDHRGGRSGQRLLRRQQLVRARQHRRRAARRSSRAHRPHRPLHARRSNRSMTEKLPRDFYLQDTITVARALLGCILWRRRRRELLAARLVEVEAYLGANDAASHARRGLRSPRNESMYLEGGHAYVYLSYGMHWCMNVVCQEADIAEAVLLRAAIPVQGIESMRKRRPKAKRDLDMMNGPGKLTAAM